MNRIKTYDATGIAPNGKLYAGDLNLLQDTVAALSDFAQTFDAGTLRIGDNTLTISKFGTGELTLGAALRLSGYLRANAGIMPANLTTTQRNALVSPPTGLVIYNTTTVRPEINTGTPAAPTWSAFGFIPSGGGLITNADVAAGAGIVYSKLALAGAILSTDLAGGITGAQLSGYPSDANKFFRGDGAWAVPLVPANNQVAGYTPVLSDAGKIIEMNVGSANNFTVPLNATVGFPIGTTFHVAQMGAGQTTLAAAGGVTLRAYNNNLKLAGQYAVATLIKRAADDWWAAGNLIP